MKKILVVGGGGYIGTSLTTTLLENNNIVIVYDEFNFNWILKNHRKLKYKERLFFIKKKLDQVTLEDFKEVDI